MFADGQQITHYKILSAIGAGEWARFILLKIHALTAKSLQIPKRRIQP
jgi:hypothetical protein